MKREHRSTFDDGRKVTDTAISRRLNSGDSLLISIPN
jgi:hypothetical protein